MSRIFTGTLAGSESMVRLYSMFFGLAVYLDMLNAVGLNHRFSAFITQGGSALAGLALFLFPGRKALLLATSAVVGVTVIVHYPFVQNSETMLGLFGLVVVVGWLVSKPWVSGRKPLFDTPQWIVRSFPAIRLLFVLAYGAAALSKWNADFFFSEGSCALELPMAGLQFFFPHAQLSSAITSLFPWGIALAESAVILLLIFPFTRRFGAVLAIVLHLGMGFSPATPYLAFTALVCAVVVLFLPEGASERTMGWFSTQATKYPRGHIILLGSLGVAGLLILVNKQWRLIPVGPVTFDHIFGFVTVFPIALVLLWAIWVTRTQSVPRHIFRMGWEFVPFPIIAILIAVQPYLGLGNVPSFTMFSNLKTENGVSNHFLIPRGFLGTFQDDFVEVDSPGFPTEPMSWFEFTRIARTSEVGTEISLVHNNKHEKFTITAENRREFDAGWVMYKLVRTRPIVSKCSW